MPSSQSQKPTMRAALSSSLNAETTAFKDRFERAEAVLNGEANATPVRPAPIITSKKPKKVSPAGRADQTTVAPASVAVASIAVAHEAASNRVIRDSFTMPQSDYEAISTVRQRALRSGQSANKSEILRAGVLALMQMSDEELVATLSNLQKVKTGRPTTV